MFSVGCVSVYMCVRVCMSVAGGSVVCMCVSSGDFDAPRDWGNWAMRPSLSILSYLSSFIA